MRRQIIPYNHILKKRARRLRRNMTFSEVLLWNELKNGQMLGYDFDRQRPIGNYIVDFYCKNLHLALEVDGITHHNEEARQNDLIRQNELESWHVNFLRFDALLVLNKIDSVVREIENWILEYESKKKETRGKGQDTKDRDKIQRTGTRDKRQGTKNKGEGIRNKE